MHKTAVIDLVALNGSLLGEATPRLSAFAARGRVRRLRPVLPAVTCSVQASMLTGRPPGEHGIVGNGWYERDQAEIRFWKQSNRLVQAEKVWETARAQDPSVTCAKLFWWFNMYSSAEIAVTPRPIYAADGRKIPDLHTRPAGLRDDLQERLGRFPLFRFWGPGSSIVSSRWIADAARHVQAKFDPTLLLVYLPHLDYGLQKLGPRHHRIDEELGRIDEVAGGLIESLEERGYRIVVVSEYGIVPVTDAIAVNRHLREAGALAVREEQGREVLDAGASEAFAVADHQVAHVYVSEPSRVERWARLCRGIEGVDLVLDRAGQREVGLDHDRAGELVLVARPDRWFTWDYWLDERRAPDFARTVDIHRKPGYDPRELFLDPAIASPRLKIAWTLLRKRLGFRTLLDVIPLDTRLVHGSHGRTDLAAEDLPLLITTLRDGEGPDEVPCAAVRDVILEHLSA